MKSLDVVVIKEVDVKQITFTAAVLGVFWGGFLGSITGYIISGILNPGTTLIIEGGLVGSILGLLLSLGVCVLAVSYNLLSSIGVSLKVKARTVETN